MCSIGSLDPLAAAGLAADLRVYQQLGVRPVLVATAVTAQNSRQVSSIHPLPPALIAEQLRCIWEQIIPDAICIGLVPHAAGIRAVCTFLGGLAQRPPVVLDPVLCSSSGHRLSSPDARPELIKLLPLASIVTPNVDEAQYLSGLPIANVAQARTAALALSRHGCAALVTGGHLPGKQSADVLAHDDAVVVLSQPRLPAGMRGSGGILAAALSARLAQGAALVPALQDARRFVRRALRAARPLGRGRRQLATQHRAGDGVAKRSRKRIS